MIKNLEQEISKLLQEQLQHHYSNICNPGAVKTFEDYQYIIGKIAGLREATELVDQATAEVNKSRGN